MFNNIWNALSSIIWPFTVAILNLWAIGKAIWFVITFIIGVIKVPRIRNCRVFGCKAPAFVPNHYCSKHIAKEEEYRWERAKFEHRYSTPQSKESRWKYNHVTRYRNETKAKQNKFYHTRQWQRFRKIGYYSNVTIICASIVKHMA